MHETRLFWCWANDDRMNNRVSSFPWFPSSSIWNDKQKEKVRKSLFNVQSLEMVSKCSNVQKWYEFPSFHENGHPSTISRKKNRNGNNNNKKTQMIELHRASFELPFYHFRQRYTTRYNTQTWHDLFSSMCIVYLP